MFGRTRRLDSRLELLSPFATLDVSGHPRRLADGEDLEASASSASCRCGLRSLHNSFTAQIMVLCNCLTSFDSSKRPVPEKALPMNKYVAVSPLKNLGLATALLIVRL